MTVTMTLGQLAEALGATLKGPEALQITGLATLQEAGPGQLSFLANPQYRKYLDNCQAAAVLLKAADAEGGPWPPHLTRGSAQAFADWETLND